MISLLFGDIFRYNGREYIFLAKSEEILYAAQVLTLEMSKKIEELYQKRLVSGKMTGVVDGDILYCYVVLSTKDLKERMAHFAKTGRDGLSLFVEKLSVTLCKEDLQAIKDEIMTKNPIPLELRDLVKDIKI